ncbi:putative ester cyclase [Litoreibacter meonggei]|uniref:Putative ester cyclase n=1 Tax=Litoreibacter meonggei TaxID=1049199 RepID=A0A497VHK5_9RHOB|nr:ester cyclase [Litoreibacter meonggei]RLJ36163.1 putative ester cyclase [Litoreibacter meonggei]
MSANPALAVFQTALATATPDGARAACELTISPDATIHMCHPFGTIAGAQVYDTLYAPLLAAMPDLERRDMIVLSGTTPQGQEWVGCMGNYMGTMVHPWLDIPATGHLTHMRYHEFFRITDGKVTEAQIIWDIPELMMQAHAWPMAPQLGKYLCTPAPMTQDGLTASGDGTAAMDHVIAMLTHLCKYPSNPDPAVMQLERYWHPRFNWYGPVGIGTGRGVSGFRNWHQMPFLRAMPDRKLDSMGDLMSHWFGEGEYVCETGWPNMRLTLDHDGWLGVAPAGREVLLRSLDFWRLEDGLIRENWVLVDLLDFHAQTGVDVLARMREFNKARASGTMPLTLKAAS